MPTPDARYFALQWNIGFRLLSFWKRLVLDIFINLHNFLPESYHLLWVEQFSQHVCHFPLYHTILGSDPYNIVIT